MAPAFEVVHCHFPDWRFTPPDSAADAALHFHLVVGPRVPLRRDLATLANELHECRVALYRADETMDLGTGANALDHPALALAFLADLVARQPYLPQLAAGEIITTGTLTAALPIEPGESWNSGFVGIDLAPLQVTFKD
jgi:2-oxo-3-hexenedioate decarboxylase